MEVLADNIGITAIIIGNELTFSIPLGVRILSAKIRLATGFSSLKVFMGTVDMTNSSISNRWMPLCQAWREDTGNQLTGITTNIDLANFTKFTINGVISTTTNQVRISF